MEARCCTWHLARHMRGCRQRALHARGPNDHKKKGEQPYTCINAFLSDLYQISV